MSFSRATVLMLLFMHFVYATISCEPSFTFNVWIDGCLLAKFPMAIRTISYGSSHGCVVTRGGSNNGSQVQLCLNLSYMLGNLWSFVYLLLLFI